MSINTDGMRARARISMDSVSIDPRALGRSLYALEDLASALEQLQAARNSDVQDILDEGGTPEEVAAMRRFVRDETVSILAQALHRQTISEIVRERL